MGSHGDDPGIGYHYELEAHVMGGTAPMAVLHAATAGAAETIRRLDDMGTLEPGKYADLIVFYRDPIADIRNTRSRSLVDRKSALYGTVVSSSVNSVGAPNNKTKKTTN